MGWPSKNFYRNYSTSVNRRGDVRILNWENKNKLISNHPHCEGIKTGYTKTAGSCLASYFSDNGRNIVIIVLGCKTFFFINAGAMYESMFNESITLYQYAITKYNDIKKLPFGLRLK